MTYYKYQKRDGLKPVDYSEIGTGLNETFEKIQEDQSKVRTQRETDISELRAEAGSQIAEAQELARTATGDATFNERVLKVAGQSAKHMRALEKLLRAGKINPNDFAIQRQNLTDSVTQLKTIMSAYKQVVEDANAQVEANPSAMAGVNMEYVQKIVDLESQTLSVDPRDGIIKLEGLAAKIDPLTQKPIQSPTGKYESMDNILIRMMNKYKGVVLTDEVLEFAKTVKAIKITKDGITIDNALQDRETGDHTTNTVLDQLGKYVDSMSNTARVSLLADNLGYTVVAVPQGVTRDSVEFEKAVQAAGVDMEKAILTSINPKDQRMTGQFTPEQEEAMREGAKEALVNMLPYTYKEKDTSAEELRIAETRRLEKKKTTKAQKAIQIGVEPVMDLWRAKTLREVESALDNLNTNDAKTFSVTENKDGTFTIEYTEVITKTDGSTETVTKEIPLIADDIGKFYETVRHNFRTDKDDYETKTAAGRDYLSENRDDYGEYGRTEGASPEEDKTVKKKIAPVRNATVTKQVKVGKTVKNQTLEARAYIKQRAEKGDIRKGILDLVDQNKDLGLDKVDQNSLVNHPVDLTKLKETITDKSAYSRAVAWLSSFGMDEGDEFKYVTIDIPDITDGPIRIPNMKATADAAANATMTILEKIQKGEKIRRSDLEYPKELEDILYSQKSGKSSTSTKKKKPNLNASKRKP